MKKIPKILLDARMIQKKKHGIALYVSELLQGLQNIKNKNYELSLLIHDNEKNPLFHGFQTISSNAPFLTFKKRTKVIK